MRFVLKQCFELNSYDIYQPENGPPKSREKRVDVGYRYWTHASLDDFLNEARRSSDLFLVRTHEFIPADDRAIYVVRDGRAVLASYRKFLFNFADVDRPLADLIEGKHWPGKWSEHVRRWLARPASTTLVLRYEDLSGPAGPPLDQISEFIGRSSLRKFDIKFSDLHALEPRHFDVGHNEEGIAMIERDFSQVFWEHNGDMMLRLKYAP
jgi:hypothetical protein